MSAPAASVVVPCRNVEGSVKAALAGVLESSFRDVEVIAVDDGSTDGTWRVLETIARDDARVRPLRAPGHGVSAARNAGMDAATGEFIFFLDADDVVEPDLVPTVISAMRRANADYCRFAHDETPPHDATGPRIPFPLKADYRFDSPDEILSRYIPCFFGYSFEQVRNWYAGQPLMDGRERGGVAFGCFRAAVIRAAGIRFDETVEIFEDAMFTSEYLLACHRTTAVDAVLYHYLLKPSGSMLSKLSGPEFFRNKLRLLAKRKALDAKSGGRLTSQYAASCVFSLLELLRAAFVMRGCFAMGLSAFRQYGRDPVVRTALRGFPLSWRRPGLAVGVLLCRCLFGRAGVCACCGDRHGVVV